MTFDLDVFTHALEFLVGRATASRTPINDRSAGGCPEPHRLVRLNDRQENISEHMISKLTIITLGFIDASYRGFPCA
ncbi:hypothetical protein D3C78_1863230 [compost metagenome]